MRKLSTFVVIPALAILGACGGNGSDSVQGPTDPVAEPAVLDFSAIEGEWSGTARDGHAAYWIEASIGLEAEPNRSVGTVDYGFLNSDRIECSATWLARSARDPEYSVLERISFGGDVCPNGVVRLERNPETGSLSYEFTAEGGDGGLNATGTLTRSE